jgi:hypothetical protein
MDAPQEPFYSKTKGGPATASILEVIGDRELPDAWPNASQRTTLKDLAHSLRAMVSPVELVYLASALEVEANELSEEGRSTS